MNTPNQDIRDKIILQALEDVAFEGWHWHIIEEAGVKAGYGEDMAFAVFPEKLEEALAHFSDWADRRMVQDLSTVDVKEMRVRDRIKTGVETRFKILEPYKEAVRAANAYWIIPPRKVQAMKLLWKTADKIWIWAGDEATDYNHYTKRILLSGVMMATTMVWLNDKSVSHQDTSSFLDRRINNVLTVGKGAGKILGPVFKKFKFMNKERVEI